MYNKPSPTRDAIWHAIINRAHIFSAGSLRRIFPKTNKVTVYRAIQSFLSADKIDAVYHDGKEQWYELHGNGKNHHHHGLCTTCGTVQCVPCHMPQNKTRGFWQTHHNAWFSGICKKCK